MHTKSIRFHKFVFPLSIAMMTLTACGGSDNDGLITTNNMEISSAPIDWTGRACESPAYTNSLGTYTGELTYQDTAARSCRWRAEIIIAGANALATENCVLSGNVKITLIEQGTQLDNTPYLCAEMDQTTGYATGLESDLDLNIASPTSFQVQLDEPLAAVDENGLELIHAVTQFESLTVGGGSLMAVTGTIPRLN